MRSTYFIRFLATAFLINSAALGQQAADKSLYQQHVGRMNDIRSAMLGSMRASWEQGTAGGAILQLDNPEYSVFGSNPFEDHGNLPVSTLQLALSAVVRQASDGRLSQEIGDGTDGAALDGASAGSAVLLGTYTDSSQKDYWQTAADAQLNFVINVAPRTSTGAISHRADSKQYWSDGVFVGFPFIAAYGAVTNNQSLLQLAYDQIRLYRDALLLPGPTGNLWAHIYSDDDKAFVDSGLWATGNGWAALGMLHVQSTILKSSSASSMSTQTNNLTSWIKEILDGTFKALTQDNLVPDYITGGATFGDASSSAALASVAFRSAKLNPKVFGQNYTSTATNIALAVLKNVDNLGVISPYVDPLNWNNTGTLSTEGQAFSLMMMAAWRDWVGA